MIKSNQLLLLRRGENWKTQGKKLPEQTKENNDKLNISNDHAKTVRETHDITLLVESYFIFPM